MKCRCCNGDNLHRYLDLGVQPLANSYHKNELLEKFPLEVDVCTNCFHSQLSIVVDPKVMFDHYLYVSGTTQTFRLHCKNLAIDAAARSRPGARVLDVACNDGLLLECFRDLKCHVQGVDPAKNLRKFTEDKDIPVEVTYWNQEVAQKLGKFDVITATNVFAHVHDVQDFLESCKTSLNHDGFVVIEFPYCKDMILKNEFDTIYHEHLSYFLVNSFSTLTRRCGFQIFDVIQTPIHGWSIRFFIRPSDNPDCHEVEDLIVQEKEKGMLELKTYEDFKIRIDQLKKEFLEEVGKHKKVVGYGASAKGNTMLNFFNLKLEYIVDDNPLKWDYLTPGMDIPIRCPETLAEEDSIAVVILSWNFGKEIMRKIASLKKEAICLFYVPKVAKYEANSHIALLQ